MTVIVSEISVACRSGVRPMWDALADTERTDRVLGFSRRRLEPPLTTIPVPAEEMGRNAAIALHAALTGKKKLNSEMLETTIKVRNSASKPPTS